MKPAKDFTPQFYIKTPEYIEYPRFAPRHIDDKWYLEYCELGTAIEEDGREYAKLKSNGDYLIVSDDLKERTRAFISNDYLFGIPTAFTQREGYVYQSFTAIGLKDMLDVRIKSGELSNLDKKKAIELFESIDDEDNNIMFWGKLKK